MRSEIIYVAGTQAQRQFRPFNSKIRIAHPSQDDRAQAKREDIRIAEFQRALEELEGSGSIVLIECDNVGSDCDRRSIIISVIDRRIHMANSRLSICFAQSSARKAIVQAPA